MAVERAGKMEGPLFRQRSEWLQEDAQTQPLQQMNVEERLVADYGGTGHVYQIRPAIEFGSRCRHRDLAHRAGKEHFRCPARRGPTRPGSDAVASIHSSRDKWLPLWSI